jgi:hypothetical protein
VTADWLHVHPRAPFRQRCAVKPLTQLVHLDWLRLWLVPVKEGTILSGAGDTDAARDAPHSGQRRWGDGHLLVASSREALPRRDVET